MMMLRFGFRAASAFRGRTPCSSSSSSSSSSFRSLQNQCWFSSSSSSSSSCSPHSKFVFATADGVLGEEEVPELEANFLQPRVLVYDGVCHLCHNGVKWLIKVDKYKQIKFCCLQSEAAEPYLNYCGVDREDVLRRFLFVEGPNTFSQGSTAALRIASYLPLPYSTLEALVVIPTPLRDAVYDYVSKRRYDWFGKEEDCEALDDWEILQRFVDRKEIWDRCKDKYREDDQ